MYIWLRMFLLKIIVFLILNCNFFMIGVENSIGSICNGGMNGNKRDLWKRSGLERNFVLGGK